MQPSAVLLTEVLGFATLAAQLLILAVILALVLKEKGRPYLEMLAPYALFFAFLLSLAGSVITLIYSEVFGITACGLCWLQRCFLYPMPVLLGIALWKKDNSIWKYILGLSIPGALIALYQHYLQVGGTGFLPCPAAPEAADCAQRIMFELGYITYPLMAFTAFVLIGLLMLVLGVVRRHNVSPTHT
jgi:disulfide bond formation protein DsbB